jgi:hypothetical protein
MRRVLYRKNPLTGQFYANIAQSLNGGTASYNGFYVSVNKALTHGVSMLTNYTFSHCISDPYDQQTSGNGLTPPGNRRAYRGNCTVGNADVRHYFTLNMVVNTPKFSNSTLQTVLGNWQIAPILALKSGNFLSILSGTDRALTTATGQTANQVSPDVYSPNKGKACVNVVPCVEFLNKNAFEIPALGTYGNMRYGAVEGPGLIQLNMAISRTFGLGEKRTLQLRGEAFNLPNHMNPLILTPNLAVNSAQFGRVTADQGGISSQVAGATSGGYRVIQLALKLAF